MLRIKLVSNGSKRFRMLTIFGWSKTKIPKMPTQLTNTVDGLQRNALNQVISNRK